MTDHRDDKPRENDRTEGNTYVVTARRSIFRIAICGILAAVIFLATQLKVNTAIGYGNLGDGFILASSFLLGPLAFFPAAIGSALADLFLGYAAYVPATFVIKGLMGLVAGLCMRKKENSLLQRLIATLIAEMIMIGGYFCFESLPFMYGVAAAIGSASTNIFQGVLGVILGLLFTQVLRRLKIRYYDKLHGRNLIFRAR